MKTQFTLFFFLLTHFSIAQILYVSQSATGNNDGTSWEHAFTNLKDALLASPAGGEVMVAEGIYTPDAANGSVDSSFIIDSGITLRGGYSAAGEYDPEQYLTVLSGDLNGDDVSGDLTSNRQDNVKTILEITENVTDATIIDGFIIKGGNANGSGSDGSLQNSGGGIYSLGAPHLKNCIVEDNFAQYAGAGLYAYGVSANGIQIENCKIQNNLCGVTDLNSGGNSAGFYAGLIKGDGVSILNCEFLNNSAHRGAGFYLWNSNGAIDSTIFIGNVGPQNGGGIRAWLTTGNPDLQLHIQNSYFEDNASSGGGGLYFAGWDDNNKLIVDNCEFIANRTIQNSNWPGQSGGGMFAGSAPGAENINVTILNSKFHGNLSNGNGSAIHSPNNGVNTKMTVQNCDFQENINNGYFGTVNIWNNNEYSAVSIVDCNFESNESVNSGAIDLGAWVTSDTTKFTVQGCNFIYNHAQEYAGALMLWGNKNTTSDFLLEDCLIQGNTADERMGGVHFQTTSSDFNVRINRCEIIDNGSHIGSAAGSFTYDMEPDDFPIGASVIFENTLFVNNSGDGSTIDLEEMPEVKFLNVTVADNQGAGVKLDDQSSVIMQNSIFSNHGYVEFVPTEDTLQVTSMGGNLIADQSLDAVAHETDLQNTTPDFVATGVPCEYYSLAEGSPGIGQGINEIIHESEFDFCGNERIHGSIDIGAIESEFEGVTSSTQVINEQLDLEIFPNPATDHFQITSSILENQSLTLTIYDALGKNLKTQTVSLGQTIPIQELPVGTYYLKIQIDQQVYTGKFLKL